MAAPGVTIQPLSVRLGYLLPVAVVVAAIAIAHGRAIPHPFLIDDPHVILADERVRNFDVSAILTREYWPGGGAGNRVWRPLTTLTLALQWQITHAPWAFRTVNLALHAAAALALFALARRILDSTAVAVGVAVLFAVHPIHTTPLNQIVDRADILASALSLTAAVLMLREFATPRRWRPLLLGVMILAALLSKESALALVGIAPVLWWFARDAGRGGSFRSFVTRVAIPLVVATAAYLLLRTAVLGGLGRGAAEVCPLDNILADPAIALAPGENVALARWGTPLAVFAIAAAKLVWPASLSWDYSYAAIGVVRQWTDPRMIAGAGVFVGLLVAAIWSLFHTRRTFVAVGMFLAGYAIVANVFFLIGAIFAERYMYLPCAAACLLAGRFAIAAANHVVLDRPRIAAALALPAVAAILACVSFDRHADFRSQARLDYVDLVHNTNSARLWAAVAADQLAAGEASQAMLSAAQSTVIFARDPTAWRILGAAKYQLGEQDESLAAMLRSIELGGIAHENAAAVAARLLVERGDYGRAVAILDRHIAAAGSRATAQAKNNLAWYLLTAAPESLRDASRAVALAESAVAASPDDADFADTCAEAYLAVGRRKDAIALLDRTLQRLPSVDPRRPALSEKRRRASE